MRQLRGSFPSTRDGFAARSVRRSRRRSPACCRSLRLITANCSRVGTLPSLWQTLGRRCCRFWGPGRSTSHVDEEGQRPGSFSRTAGLGGRQAHATVLLLQRHFEGRRCLTNSLFSADYTWRVFELAALRKPVFTSTISRNYNRTIR